MIFGVGLTMLKMDRGKFFNSAIGKFTDFPLYSQDDMAYKT